MGTTKISCPWCGSTKPPESNYGKKSGLNPLKCSDCGGVGGKVDWRNDANEVFAGIDEPPKLAESSAFAVGDMVIHKYKEGRGFGLHGKVVRGSRNDPFFGHIIDVEDEDGKTYSAHASDWEKVGKAKTEVFAGIDEPPKLAELANSMDDEKISSLYVKFHTWATKKAETLPSGAPVLTQILDGMAKVDNEVRKNPSAKGEEAVRLILKAMDGEFNSGAQPIPYLIRKYGQRAISQLSPRGYISEDGSAVGGVAGFNGPLGGIPTPKTKKVKESDFQTDSPLPPGTKVRVPHKGKMVVGKVVRFDNRDRGRGGSDFYVVYVPGEYESLIVPIHKVEVAENLGFGMGTNQIEKGMREKQKTDSMDISGMIPEGTDTHTAEKFRSHLSNFGNSPIDGKEKRAAAAWVYKNIVAKTLDGFFRDDSWQPIHAFFKKLEAAGLKATLDGSEYQHNAQGQPTSKQWKFTIPFLNKRSTQDKLSGTITAHGAGSVQDPLDRYDITCIIG